MAKKAVAPVMNANAKTERAVLVTTIHRGVFFGYYKSSTGDTIRLRACRNCVYWSSELRGFLGLADSGPSDKCRVGPPADAELYGVTCVAEVSAAAIAAWESAPWSS